MPLSQDVYLMTLNSLALQSGLKPEKSYICFGAKKLRLSVTNIFYS